jgi:biotin carboxyl carrier protein
MSTADKPGKATSKPEPPLEELEIGSVRYMTRITTKFRNRKFWSRPNEKMILAVIPGTIQRLMVKAGDAVETGTPMLILEAMKMRNEIRALRPGVIKKIHVKEGELVSKAQPLLEFK